MLNANVPAKPEIVSQLPEWYTAAVKSIEQRKKDYLDDYYDGWVTYSYLNRKLDELDHELSCMVKQLQKENRSRIEKLYSDSVILTENPF